MKNRLKLLSYMLAVSVLTTSCSFIGSDNGGNDAFQDAKEQFYANSQKIRATINDKENNVTALFEGYIDTNGNGQGLLEVGDIVREVAVVENKLVLTLFDETYSVTDIGSYFTFDSLTNIEGPNDSVQLTGGKISIINGEHDQLRYNVRFEEVDKSFEKQTITINQNVTLNEMIDKLADANSEKSDESSAVGQLMEEDPEPVEPKEKEPSFYVKNALGIKVGDSIYSLGDKVNEDDYYNGEVPEGISYDYVWDSTKKIETKTTSYLDTTGQLTVMTIDGIAFELSTTAEFEFLGLYKGQDVSEVKKLLGIGLSKKDLENFKPIYDGFEVVKASAKEIECKVGAVSIKIGVKDKVLNSIYISQDRGYLHYDTDKK